MAFIAGAYSAQIDLVAGALPIGVVEDGFELEYVWEGEEIVGDNLGGSVQDGIYRGGNVFLNMILLEWTQTGVQTLIWPWTEEDDVGAPPTTVAPLGAVGAIGRQWTEEPREGQRSITLTAAPASPAAIGTSPIFTLTAKLAIPTPGTRNIITMASKLRRMPIRLQLLPYVVSNDTVWFTTTAI